MSATVVLPAMLAMYASEGYDERSTFRMQSWINVVRQHKVAHPDAIDVLAGHLIHRLALAIGGAIIRHFDDLALYVPLGIELFEMRYVFHESRYFGSMIAKAFTETGFEWTTAERDRRARLRVHGLIWQDKTRYERNLRQRLERQAQLKTVAKDDDYVLV